MLYINETLSKSRPNGKLGANKQCQCLYVYPFDTHCCHTGAAAI